MKKNCLATKKRQNQSLLEEEKRQADRRAARQIAKLEKQKFAADIGEIKMTEPRLKFNRGRIQPRREYKAKRRQEKLAKNAPLRLSTDDGGDIDMMEVVGRTKKVVPVSRTFRLVKDKESISKS